MIHPEKRLLLSRAVLGLALGLFVVSHFLPWELTSMETIRTWVIWENQARIVRTFFDPGYAPSVTGRSLGPFFAICMMAMSVFVSPFVVRELGKCPKILWVQRILMAAFVVYFWVYCTGSSLRYMANLLYEQYGSGCWLMVSSFVLHVVGLMLIPPRAREPGHY